MMTIYLKACPILAILLLLTCETTAEKDEKLWEEARRELARRTREYIRDNPLSAELQAFIEDLRKPRKRRKRQDHNNMYAIQEGEVVPLSRIEEQLLTESNLGDNFTVVPLIIPIPLENTVTIKEHTTEDDLALGDGSSERGILGRGQALTAIREKNREHRIFQNSFDDSRSQNNQDSSKTEETVVDNLIDDKLKSTTESTELNRVLEDVQNLIVASKKGKKSSKEGALCNVSGYWDSESGGMTFHIKKIDVDAEIVMRPTEPPSDDGFIAQDKWNVSARVPFPQSAQVVITLTAFKGRRVAIFLGECRICEGSETITGDWLVGRTSSDCKDQKASHSFISDVLRKNNVESLRQAHIKKISTMLTTSTTPES